MRFVSSMHVLGALSMAVVGVVEATGKTRIHGAGMRGEPVVQCTFQVNGRRRLDVSKCNDNVAGAPGNRIAAVHEIPMERQHLPTLRHHSAGEIAEVGAPAPVAVCSIQRDRERVGGLVPVYWQVPLAATGRVLDEEGIENSYSGPALTNLVLAVLRRQ